MMKPSRQPSGKLRDAIDVARALSLSPNQTEASLEGELRKKA